MKLLSTEQSYETYIESNYETKQVYMGIKKY